MERDEAVLGADAVHLDEDAVVEGRQRDRRAMLRVGARACAAPVTTECRQHAATTVPRRRAGHFEPSRARAVAGQAALHERGPSGHVSGRVSQASAGGSLRRRRRSPRDTPIIVHFGLGSCKSRVPMRDLVADDHLQRTGDGDRREGSEDARNRRSDQNGDEDGEGRELDRAAVDHRLEDVVLDLLVDDEEDDGDQARRAPSAGTRRRRRRLRRPSRPRAGSGRGSPRAGPSATAYGTPRMSKHDR